jgi:hypothetical protein
MATWRVMARAAVMVAASAMMIAQSQLAIRKIEFLNALSVKIGAAQERLLKPEEGSGTREQYLESALAAERECRKLYAERAFAVEGYYGEQSRLLITAVGCLFATALVLNFGSEWRSWVGAALGAPKRKGVREAGNQ